MSPRILGSRVAGQLAKYPPWVARHHLGIIVAATLATVVGSLLAATLPLRTEFSWLLPDDRASVVALRELTARKPSSAVIEVGIASPSPEATERFAQDLAAALRAKMPADLMRSVDEDDGELRRFVWEHRHLYASLGDLERVRDSLKERIASEETRANPFLVELDDTPKPPAKDALADLRARLDEVKRGADHPGFIAEEGRLRMLVVRCPFGDTEPEKGKRVLDALKTVVAGLNPSKYHAALEVGYAGDPVSAALEHDLVIRDVAVSALMCLGLVIAVLLIAFRAPRAVLALSLSLAAGCALTFGLTRLWVGHLNSSTAFLGSVVAGNGINFGIIFLARYIEERRRGGDHEPSLRTAILRTAGPTAVGAVAAGTAYLSLTITSFRGFSEFGIIAGSGMVLCWAMSYSLLPALLTLLDRRKPLATMRAADANPPSTAPLMRSRFLRTVPLLAVALTTAVGVYGAIKLSRDPFEDNLQALRSRSYPESEPGRWSRRLDAAFGRDQSGGFYIGTEKAEDVPAIVAALTDAEREVPPRERLFGKIDSLPHALPGTQGEQLRKIALLDELHRLSDKIAPHVAAGSDDERLLADVAPKGELRPITTADLPPGLRRAFTENDGRIGLLIAVHPGPGYINGSHRSMRRAVGILRGMPLPDSIRSTVQISGPEMIFVDMMAAVQRDGPRATVFSLCLVLLLLLAAFGVSRDLAVTVFALFAGVLGMLGIMTLAHLKLNFLSFIAIPITIGIGVDYPFNVAARLRDEPLGDGWGRSLMQTGSAVILCSLTTVIGYAVLITSDTGAIRSFGMAAVIGEITCIVAGVVSVPSLLLLLRRVRRSGSFESPRCSAPPRGLAGARGLAGTADTFRLDMTATEGSEKGRAPFKLLLRLGVILVVGVLCALLLRGLDMKQVLETLRHADWRLVAVAVGANMTLNVYARVCRWRSLLRPLPRTGDAPHWWELCSLLLASGAASNLLPARAGEALRTVQLRRRHGFTVGGLVAVQLLEKVIEGLSLGLLALPVALWGTEPTALRVPLFGFATLGVVGVLLLILLPRGAPADSSAPVSGSPVEAPSVAIPVEPLAREATEAASTLRARRLVSSVKHFLGRLADGMKLLRAPRVWSAALFWSLVSDLADASMAGLCLHAIGVALPVGSWVVVLLAINVAIALPSTPAQVGVLEAGAVLALAAFGVPHSQALAFAVLYHAAHVIPTTAAGLVGLRLQWRRRPIPESA